MDSGTSAPGVAVVHHVIMKEREIVEHLHAGGRTQRSLATATESVGRHHEQRGTQPLASGRHAVSHRAVEALKIAGRICHVAQIFLYLCAIIGKR